MVKDCIIISESSLFDIQTPFGSINKKILGQSVLCRTILTAVKCGLSSFTVITKDVENIKKHIADNKAITRDKVKVEVSSPDSINAPDLQSDHFLVLTDNSFFSPEYIEAFSPETNQITLIEDSHSSDKSAALIPSGFFASLLNSVKSGENKNFSDLISNLGVPARSVKKSVHRGFLVHLSSKDNFKTGFSKLLNSVRKDTDGFVSKYFNRYVSLFCSRIFINLRLSPNTISFSNFFLGLVSAWLIGVGGYQNNVIAALIFQFTSIIDGSDGEVAKLTFNCSPNGAWIDTICDQLTYLVFFIALPIGLYNTSGSGIYIILGVLTILSIPATYLQMTAYVKKAGGEGSMLLILEDIKKSGEKPGIMGAFHRFVASITFIFRRDFFSFAVMLIAFVNKLNFIMWGVAVLLVFQTVYLFFYSKARFKKPA